MEERNDGELVACAREGDRAAFDELVRRHHGLAVRAARRWIGHEELAREVAQEALLAAYLSPSGCSTSRTAASRKSPTGSPIRWDP